MTLADLPELHAAVREARRRALADALDTLDDVRQRWYGADARAALTEAEDELLRLLDERDGGLRSQLDEALAFLRRTATTGGSIVSSAAMTATQIAIARAADRMFVTPDGHGFVYVPGPRFCACGRVESDCDQSRAACPKADPTGEGDANGSEVENL